jgi:hypothetical protein
MRWIDGTIWTWRTGSRERRGSASSSLLLHDDQVESSPKERGREKERVLSQADVNRIGKGEARSIPKRPRPAVKSAEANSLKWMTNGILMGRHNPMRIVSLSYNAKNVIWIPL